MNLCSFHGMGFVHSKGTWGSAARKGILFRTYSLAKGLLFGNFTVFDRAEDKMIQNEELIIRQINDKNNRKHKRG